MTQNEIARKWFIKTALSYLGTPYFWGGDDPSGFDCSGFVIECMKSAGLLKENEDFTADGLCRLYKDRLVEKPTKGNLLFSLNRNRIATHVAICLDDYFQIGAFGGDSKNINIQNAWSKNAFVKIRPIELNNPKIIYVDMFEDITMIIPLYEEL
jgi:cell wall-associated NlpC family hydrolase